MAASLDTTLDALGNVLSLVNDSAGGWPAPRSGSTRRPTHARRTPFTASAQAEAVVTSAGEWPPASTPWPPAPSRWSRRSARSRRTPPRRPACGQAVVLAEATNGTVGKLGDSSQEIGNGDQGDQRRSPSRRTCWRSTRRSRRPGRARPARASPSSPARSRSWRRRRRGRPRTSPSGSRPSRPTPRAPSTRSAQISVIGEINDFQATIAAAVEEQTATTNEMNRNVAEAASGLAEHRRGDHRAGSGHAGDQRAGGRRHRAAGELSRMSGDCRGRQPVHV